MRPKVLVYYSQFRKDAYDLSGAVAGTPITLHVAKDRFEYGAIEVAGELNHVFQRSEGRVVIPYAELSARYEFVQPNSGKFLTPNLTLDKVSPWSGTLRLGTRALVTRTASAEISAGYLSLGQNGLDVWEGRIFLSFAF